MNILAEADALDERLAEATRAVSNLRVEAKAFQPRQPDAAILPVSGAVHRDAEPYASQDAAAAAQATSCPSWTLVGPSQAQAELRQQVLAQACTLLRLVLPPSRIGLVGSMASGLALDASDIDLVCCLGGPFASSKWVPGIDRLREPLLVLMLTRHEGRLDSWPPRGAKASKPARRRKDLRYAFDMALAPHGFASKAYRDNSPLVRIEHIETGLTVDLWEDERAAVPEESEAMRRVQGTMAALAATPQLGQLHRALRGALGDELREYQGYVNVVGQSRTIGSFVILLMVRRFLGRQAEARRREGGLHGVPWQALLPPLLSELSDAGNESARKSEEKPQDELLEDVLPGMPPIVLQHGKASRMLAFLTRALGARLLAGAALEPLLYSTAATQSTGREALLAEVRNEMAAAFPPGLKKAAKMEKEKANWVASWVKQKEKAKEMAKEKEKEMAAATPADGVVRSKKILTVAPANGDAPYVVGPGAKASRLPELPWSVS